MAGDALTGLGEIYQANMAKAQAIRTYQRLIQIQQKSYNYFGLINTYDTLGKIHLESNQKIKAKKNFKEALVLAKSLDYKVNYFAQRIKQLNN